jgi:hypothetical protein
LVQPELPARAVPQEFPHTAPNTLEAF